jgi:tRNA-splicing ligase RtcB
LNLGLEVYVEGDKMVEDIELKKINDCIWEIPKTGDMVVPGRVYGDEDIVRHLRHDIELGKEWNALTQIRNVACLPGIQRYALAMADIHPGYGYPIGGIGAFELENGVISVAGVGFDINCGVRTMKTQLTRDDVMKVQKELADSLFRTVPAGIGSKGDVALKEKEIDELLIQGAEFVINRDYGFRKDMEYIEENGCVRGADPSNVSLRSKQREYRQIGTLGSGNHYLEVQYVEKVEDEKAAKAFGLFENQILISIHCGSRALGHQIGTDYLQTLEQASKKYGIPIRDKELVCAPINSPEGQKYFSAVNAGINCAFANRQAIAHLTRKAFKFMGVKPDEIETFYDIGHNNVKLEKHKVDGKMVELMVHRKGSTRAFGPGRDEVPKAYRKIGQPVLVGGTMGTASYILHGTERGMEETFGSAIHGAGRIMSRNQAKGGVRGEQLIRELADKGIIIMGHSMAGIAEEAPSAYKAVEQVVDVMHNSDIARKVVRLRPLISIKG